MCVNAKMSDGFCAGKSGSAAPSLHGEAAGLLHGRQQLLVELLVGLVGGDVDPVEAGHKGRAVGAKEGDRSRRDGSGRAGSYQV